MLHGAAELTPETRAPVMGRMQGTAEGEAHGSFAAIHGIQQPLMNAFRMKFRLLRFGEFAKQPRSRIVLMENSPLPLRERWCAQLGSPDLV
mmetsp:Transcript_92875/g.262616  ORF Transcript_92875/g.262616 Transcript_92875/m.262616 type:complete len:91 (-) Transcript_92875:73-345(-)